MLTTEVPTRQHWILLLPAPAHPGRFRRARWWGEARPTFFRTAAGCVFGGNEKDCRGRIYLQDIDSGSIRAISPEGVGTAALATPDGRHVFGWTGGRLFKYAVDEGAPVPRPF